MSPRCPDHGLSAGFFHQCMKFKEKINIGSTLVSYGLSSTGLTPRGRKSMSQKVRMTPLQLAVWLSQEGREHLRPPPSQVPTASGSPVPPSNPITCFQSRSRGDQRGTVTQPNSSPQWKNPVTCPPGSRQGCFCIWKGSKPRCSEGPFVFHLLAKKSRENHWLTLTRGSQCTVRISEIRTTCYSAPGSKLSVYVCPLLTVLQAHSSLKGLWALSSKTSKHPRQAREAEPTSHCRT